MVPLSRNHFLTPVIVRFSFYYVVITPQNGVFNNEMLKHQPFGWLKSKKDGRLRCIGEVSWSDAFETVHIALSTSESLSRSANSMFDEYTFADGAPFGVMEE